MRNKQYKYLLLFKCICCCLFVYEPRIVFAQAADNITLHRDILNVYDKYFNRVASTAHTSIRPLSDQECQPFKDSVQPFINRPADIKPQADDKAKAITFQVQPIVDALGGGNINEPRLTFEIAGGITLTSRIYNKLTLSVSGLAGNGRYADYTNNLIIDKHIVPVYGWAYRSGKNYSYQSLSGYLSFSPNKIFNFQVGQGKHFLGDGYRSLFLSDVANVYPYLRITTNIWKLKYVSLFAINKDITQPVPYQNKYAAFHYLSYNVTKHINVGVFESIVWQGADSNRARGFDVNYLNPVIFYRPVEYSLGSSDNAFIGFSFKIKWCSYFQTYGQLILDEFYLKEVIARKGWWANKQGFQLGARFFDLLKINNLDLRLELNYVRPYTYSHGTSKQNYGHFNMPLAHPLGANFKEGITEINYRYKNWLLGVRGIFAIYGADSAGYNMGHNIFESYTTRSREYNNYTTQGLKTSLLIADVKVGYLVNRWNTELLVGVISRSESYTSAKLQSNCIYIGIRSLLFNNYRDF